MEGEPMKLKKGSKAARSFMAKLRDLRAKGRRIVKRAKIKGKKPFYFSGKRRRPLRSIRRFSEPLEPFILKEGSLMAKRKRRSAKRVRHVVYGRKSRRSSRRRYHGGEILGRRRSSRRRYHGGGTKFNPIALITEVAGLGAGAVAGSFAAKFTPIANPKIKALVPLILGILLTQLKFARSKIVRDMATGSMAIGTISLIKQFIPQLPLLAGSESAESIISSLKQLPPEEQALLGMDGADSEVLTGAGDENEIPAEAVIQ